MSAIGIFTGAFDPIHSGHLAFAHKALNLSLDKIYFLPEPKPRMKPNVSDLDDRISKLNKATEQDSRLGVIKLKQNNFEVQSVLSELNQIFPDSKFVFLFGDDVLDHLANWKDLDIFAKETEFLIATRNNSIGQISNVFKDFKLQGLGFNYQIIELNEGISSTEIRSRDTN
ncbi:hypothetical protein A3F37_00900 [Candidatus Saccharibacteria bacterium RIFCSPHIGHO2_12_FULL_41_12]|nr:MAG: hypothetical protein A3F37_00900 [Candidatus Saccharibacteria bacterium RIFCSPHIGHO2_12_FULL_41_12]